MPQRTLPAQDLIEVIDGALPLPLYKRARAAIARLGNERLRQSYFTTFWMPLAALPRHALEEAVLALAGLARPKGCAGAEWWLGRTHTTRVPIEFHFDQDVKRRERGGRLIHPEISTVLFFNRVRGGQLAVTDQRAGEEREATALQTVAPLGNRYAIFAGDLFHGVLDRNGEVPTRPLPGPRGRLRISLVVNFWRRRPTGVPEWSESRAYRGLVAPPRRHARR